MKTLGYDSFMRQISMCENNIDYRAGIVFHSRERLIEFKKSLEFELFLRCSPKYNNTAVLLRNNQIIFEATGSAIKLLVMGGCKSSRFNEVLVDDVIAADCEDRDIYTYIRSLEIPYVYRNRKSHRWSVYFDNNPDRIYDEESYNQFDWNSENTLLDEFIDSFCVKER